MSPEVLVVSERPKFAASVVEACTRHFVSAAVRPDAEIGDTSGVFAVVADVALDVESNASMLRSLKARCGPGVQMLVVMHDDDRRSRVQAGAVGGTVFLHAGVEPSAVAARVLQLAAARPDRLDGRTRAAVVGAQGACAALANVFEAARAGRSMDVSLIDVGTRLVMEAIDKGGIANWLDVVRAYDDRLYQRALMVGGLAAAFSSSLGFPDADRVRLVRAALVHDVGMARMPVSILKKRGRLEPHEMAIIQTHPRLGRQMLADAGADDPVMLEVVLHHHELLDGSGYPDGLAGDEIGDFVRLVTVCDIYAALICPRPPRASFDVKEALEKLEVAAQSEKLESAIVRMFGRAFASEEVPDYRPGPKP